MRQLHHFSDRFSCISDIRCVLLSEFSENIPDEETEYSIFEGRHQTNRWLVSNEDVAEMYQKFRQGETSLWCDNREPEEESSPMGKKRNSQKVE